MAAIRFRSGRMRAGFIGIPLAVGFLLAGPAPLCADAEERVPLRDVPVVWYDDDARDVPPPRERRPNHVWDSIDASVQPMGRLTHPGRAVRRVGRLFGGDPAAPAANVNGLDEVPNSTWFTNRIGLFPMTPEEVAVGPGRARGPDPSGGWTVVGAKTEGVTPGFRIRDGQGAVYLIKFDPPDYPRMPSAAGVISGKLLHAAGYNVPEDAVVTFRREDLSVGEGVPITLVTGERRTMNEADLDTILARVRQEPDGGYRAVASRFLNGKPAGPFDWRGRRKDDPNDRIDHENRRELRGLRLIAAWINHFDTKQENTLDMLVEEGGRRHLRHYLIDFASTLGAGATGPEPGFGFEYSFDFPAMGGRALALGFHEDAWRRLERPDSLAEIGYFESEEFDPDEWKPLLPNAAFANLTAGDGYWAAKIISAFTDAHLEAAVATGRYRDPAAARWIVRVLGERRDEIARLWFERVPPLDFFVFTDGALAFHDLAAEREIYPGTTARYRTRATAATPEGKAAKWTSWREIESPRIDPAWLEEGSLPGADSHPFWVFEVGVDRGRGWSGPVAVVVARGSGRVIEVRR